MRQIKVLSIQRISPELAQKIEAVDGAVQLTDAGGWYDGEVRETWPSFGTSRSLGANCTVTAAARNATNCSPRPRLCSAAGPTLLDLRSAHQN